MEKLDETVKREKSMEKNWPDPIWFPPPWYEQETSTIIEELKNNARSLEKAAARIKRVCNSYPWDDSVWSSLDDFTMRIGKLACEAELLYASIRDFKDGYVEGPLHGEMPYPPIP